MPADEAVVSTAVAAAESVIFSRYDTSDIRDLDVTVRFQNDQLSVDIYLNVPDAPDEQRVADDAALAAREAVDDLLEQ